MIRKWVEEARLGDALHFDIADSDGDVAVADDTIADITDDVSDVDDVVQKEKENIDEVAPASSMDSEETHGGNEATKDIEDSLNAADDGENEENDGAEQGESAPDDENYDSDENDNYNDNNDSDDNDNNDVDDDNGDEYHNQKAFDLQAAAKKRLAAAFATVIGKVAEDLDTTVADGDDEWDFDALMMRRFTRRSIYECMQSREKQSVVMVLDTSGSCSQQADLYAEIANIASKRGDVVIYDAPNAVTERVCEHGVWREREDEEWWRLKNRTILFFGDFDGGWNVIQASKSNKLFWFSNEERYSDTSEHSWCYGVSLSEFKGKYFPCFSEKDFFNLIKKIK